MHRIRLRGPWEFAQLTPGDDLPTWLKRGARTDGRLTLPMEIEQLPSSPSGSRLVVSRSFNRPTGLDELTSLRLVLSPTNFAECVWLNGAPLSADAGDSVYEILSSIQPNNRVYLELAQPRLLAQAEVWLELCARR